MNKQRLRALADGLLRLQRAIDLGEVAEEVFNMKQWRDEDSKPLKKQKKGFDCGFAGCAIGWAGKFIPKFPFGFKATGSGGYTLTLNNKKMTVQSEYTALGKYFGVTVVQANCLFGPYSYGGSAQPKDVAHRIYCLIANGVI